MIYEFSLQGYPKNQINLRVLWKYCHLIDDKSSVCGEERAKEGEKEDVRNNDTENMMKCDIANMTVLSLVPYQFKTMFVCVCVCVHVYACVYVHAFAYVCKCICCMSMGVFVCMYECMHTCICNILSHAFFAMLLYVFAIVISHERLTLSVLRNLMRL